ncbi:MAG TPA: acetyl-CoA hydrolase/transferase C-terminal domain-containing protein [Acidimicrobiales bacterium]|nr:acetyl-CoA hydrolase/transferase C-terminal domain-containing protein [Acidimicrobiales bacterium]
MKFVTERELEKRLGALLVTEPRVVASGNFATPWRLVALFDAAVERYRLFVLNAQIGIPRRAGVLAETPFVGPGMRDTPGLDYLPMRLSLVPRLFASSRPPDVVLVHTSIERNGKVSLGTEVNILPAAIERARGRNGLVIAQVNRQMPYTFGDGELDVDAIDLAIAVDEELACPVQSAPSDISAAIGSNVATLVEEKATIQVGIGGVPDAILGALTGVRRLGIWSEVISDGVFELEQAGALDDARPIVTTFLFGSNELYAWADLNPRVQVLRTETVNDPSRIAAQPMMCSLNTALQVDLFAQANAAYVRGDIYSGFGGQPDFVVGALHSPGGHAVIALASWHAKSNTSTIVSRLTEPVTSFQHSAVITEQGQALLFGRSRRSQVRLLIEEAAHPRARSELWNSVGDRSAAG